MLVNQAHFTLGRVILPFLNLTSDGPADETLSHRRGTTQTVKQTVRTAALLKRYTPPRLPEKEVLSQLKHAPGGGSVAKYLHQRTSKGLCFRYCLLAVCWSGGKSCHVG